MSLPPACSLFITRAGFHKASHSSTCCRRELKLEDGGEGTERNYNFSLWLPEELQAWGACLTCRVVFWPDLHCIFLDRCHGQASIAREQVPARVIWRAVVYSVTLGPHFQHVVSKPKPAP